jgi:hypothetical protein
MTISSVEKVATTGGHRSCRNQRFHLFRSLPNTKLKWLHRSRYLPLKKFKRFYCSRYLHKKIIETDQSFFLLLSLEIVTVNRSRYGIELKKWNGKIVSVTLLFKK